MDLEEFVEQVRRLADAEPEVKYVEVIEDERAKAFRLLVVQYDGIVRVVSITHLGVMR